MLLHDYHVQTWLCRIRYAQADGRPCSYLNLPYMKQGCFHCIAFRYCHGEPSRD